MSAIPTLLADAITAVINTAEAASAFAPFDFTARRSYPDWDDDFKDLPTHAGGVSVDVVFVSSGASGGDTVELDSVSSVDTDVSIDIAVRRRFDKTGDKEANGRLKNSAVDPLVKLVEQLHILLAEDRMTSITLESGVDANWIDTSVRTYCDYKRLREGVFLGVVRVRFNVRKAVS
jgi:hypothetical protein